MQVTKSAAVALFEALGVKTAGKWNNARLAGKISKLNEMETEGAELDGEKGELLTGILSSLENEEEVELIDDGEAAEKPKKKGKKADADDDDDAVPVKKKAPKKAGGKKGPGVISSIAEFLNKTSAKKPLSKDEIVEKLVERFPDRSAESMASTVTIQLGGRLKKEKGLNINKNDKGYFIAN